MTHIIIVGTPLKGYTYYGPFATNSAAIAWAVDNLEGTHYWTAPISMTK